MRNFTLVLVAGGLLMGAAGAASAQQLATAGPSPKGDVMVFTEKGSHTLSPTAMNTIRSAVDEARDAHRITLTGSPASVAAVKGELVRQGVPENAIVARNDVPSLPKAGDGLSDATDRGVSISF
jgi:NAD(P)H-flavin reductase